MQRVTLETKMKKYLCRILVPLKAETKPGVTTSSASGYICRKASTRKSSSGVRRKSNLKALEGNVHLAK